MICLFVVTFHGLLHCFFPSRCNSHMEFLLNMLQLKTLECMICLLLLLYSEPMIRCFKSYFTDHCYFIRFGETPLKNSLESPSPWKSPWSPFVPGAQIDTDITLAVKSSFCRSNSLDLEVAKWREGWNKILSIWKAYKLFV